MNVLEHLVGLFYLPWVFWGVPFLLAIAIELYRRWRRSPLAIPPRRRR